MKLYNDGDILGVAFKSDTGDIFKLISPNRHNQLQSEIRCEIGYIPEGEYGFYTKNIEFMNRFTSRKYAKRYLGLKTDDLELNSEHLW